jgi:hypothetical protein
MCRVACVNQAVAPTGFAIVMRWLAGAVALLGSYHAVSGASAAIVGVASWSKITNGVETGPVTSSVSAAAGQALLYKIVITTPATTGAENDYYNYDTLPPGLTIRTNVGGADGLGNGFIQGTPTKGGTYAINLIAGNTLWPQTVTKAISFTISGGTGGTPPSITGPPTNQTVTAGANVSFDVIATGTAPLSYSWKFNSALVAGATTSSLQLSNVQTTNSGTYSVTITNSAGSTNASAILTVNAAATSPTISQQPVSLTVSNGASADFSVTAGGTAPLGYLWKKDGAGLSGATTSAFHLASVTTNDAAAYTVVITNSAGSTTSDVATLTVLLPPSILTPPQNTTVSIGNTATFTVVASGSPPMSYQWKFNGNALASATASSLAITNAQTGDQGDYTVVVSNAVAAVTSAPGHLTVQTAPAGPFEIKNLQAGGGWIGFDATGPAQTNIVLWSSSDLSHWAALSTNASGSGTVRLGQSNITSSVQFYRLTLHP